MVYVAYGKKPAGDPFFKVMKYDTDDHLAVANTAYDRFYFNSENQMVSYIFEPQAVYNVGQGGFPTGPINNDQPSGNIYVIEGSSASTAKRAIHAWLSFGPNYNFQYLQFLQRYDTAGIIPIFEARIRAPNGRLQGPCYYNNKIDYVGAQHNGVIYLNTSTYTNGIRPGPGSIRADFGYAGGWYGNVFNVNNISARNMTVASFPNATDVSEIYTALWTLPANNAPIPNPQGTPVTGQNPIRIDQSSVVICRRGFDAATSSGFQRIIDSDRNPPLCILAGQTGLIGAGATAFIAAPAGVTMTTSMIVDMIVRIEDRDFMVPMFDRVYRDATNSHFIEYTIAGNGITIYNSGQYTVTIKYIVFGNDMSAPTTGGALTQRRLDNGHIQLKRPGSSDTNPSLRDILLDTRFPMLQVIAEGYIPIANFAAGNVVSGMYGTRAAVVNFNAPNMFVFPKIVGVFPHALRQGYGNWQRRPGGTETSPSNQSVVTVVRDNQLVIHLSPGAPTEFANGAWQYDQPDPLGARYYILAAVSI
nr:hypothetical protein [Brucella anthropi]